MKTKTSKTNTTVQQTTEGYRLIFRGIDSKGKYKRRVTVVHGNYEEACRQLQERFPELSKGFKPESVFCNVFNGGGGSGYIEHQAVKKTVKK